MRWSTAALVILLATTALTGCIGQDADDEIDPAGTQATDQTPEKTYQLPAEITGLGEVAGVEHGSAAGLVIHDGILYGSGLSGGFFVVDISDPQDPVKLAELTELYARDADLLFTPDGTPVVALAAGSAGLHLVDVTDPANPTTLATEFDVGASVHNLAVVPNTTLIYNSRSLGDAVEPGIDIVDAADPSQPEVVEAWTFPRTAGAKPVATTGCHDITVYPEVDRAYCAGVTQTYILDIADPMAPEVLSTIENPAVTIHHWALPNQDHSILIIGDEFAGAASPASSCLAGQATPAGYASQPTAGVWFYDISDPTSPVPLSFLSAPPVPEDAVCTAHFGALVGDRPMLAVGWYTAGVLLIDFSDPMSPQLTDWWNEGHNVWDVRYDNGHLFTGNIDGGMDVLQLTGE